jgi:hypothetical protein
VELAITIRKKTIEIPADWRLRLDWELDSPDSIPLGKAELRLSLTAAPEVTDFNPFGGYLMVSRKVLNSRILIYKLLTLILFYLTITLKLWFSRSHHTLVVLMIVRRLRAIQSKFSGNRVISKKTSLDINIIGGLAPSCLQSPRLRSFQPLKAGDYWFFVGRPPARSTID